MKEQVSVNIRPGVTILSVLKHLNYKPYYALAEFVDNAIDSFLKNKEELIKVSGKDFKLRVDIEFDTINQRIVIKDNAAGIHSDDFQRAFRAAELPPDNSRLSEFGMGMKSAACWFSNKWEVRTKSLGEDVVKTVTFNIAEIVEDKVEELEVQVKKTGANQHYTVITLYDIEEKMPVRRSLGKVKRHLASIYRDFFRKDILDLYINGEQLKYKSPKILDAPYFDTPDEDKIFWKQEVEFDFGDDHKGGKLKVHGFVAIMETMSIKDSGFALFRRGRVIEGSADTDEGFRPPALSGSLGSHRYKRLFGELHLEGFDVSHTKDGFQWDDNMEIFLNLLKEKLDSANSIPILKQADRYRVRESAINLQKVSKKVVDSTTAIIKESISKDVEAIEAKPHEEEIEELLKTVSNSYHKKFPLTISNIAYMVHIELSYDETINELIQVGDHLIPEKDKNYRNIGVRLSLIHPFMIEFAGDDHKVIEPVLRLVVALGLSEILVKKAGASVTELRNNMNELLKGSLSKI